MPSVYTDRYKIVLEVLIRARKKAGLSQQEIADRLGRPQSFVSKYENGERRIDVAEFISLLQLCKVDPQRALGEILAAPAFGRRLPSTKAKVSEGRR
jgi:transcriptional regulator with XRE-family HTH domain